MGDSCASSWSFRGHVVASTPEAPAARRAGCAHTPAAPLQRSGDFRSGPVAQPPCRGDQCAPRPSDNGAVQELFGDYCLPSSTSSRKHGEFLRLLFLQPTARPRRTSSPSVCQRNNTAIHFAFAARHSTMHTELVLQGRPWTSACLVHPEPEFSTVKSFGLDPPGRVQEPQRGVPSGR